MSYKIIVGSFHCAGEPRYVLGGLLPMCQRLRTSTRHPAESSSCSEWFSFYSRRWERTSGRRVVIMRFRKLTLHRWCPLPWPPAADLDLKRPTEERADDDDDAEHANARE
jgi:hypothetical protein